MILQMLLQTHMFQFTHPGKGATIITYVTSTTFYVSIHAPWEGCDNLPSLRECMRECFNSRTLGRVRHLLVAATSADDVVSIHAPWEGCDTS